jgi:hypothetical protein
MPPSANQSQPALFTSISAALADPLLRSSSLVSRPSTLLRTVSLSNGEAYLASKETMHFLSVLRFTRYAISCALATNRHE